MAWLRYLIDHFLRRGAAASRTGDVLFDRFTFDHVLAGMVVGCRRDTKELFAIHVEDNVVTKRILRSGNDRLLQRAALAYEAVLDTERKRNPRRRPRRGGGSGGPVLRAIRPS